MNPRAWGRGVTVRVDVRKVPAAVLALVDERQGARACAKCNSVDHLELDHRIPLVAGGDNNWRNLQWLCRRCNRQKGGRRFARPSIEERLRRLDC